ncbi:MAG TPA: putative peptidoglycan binding domain-containing protein, partial [Rubrobacter sp.]|nr:putative peptidoglycan binding domain-containing protein [Rubrobacter sp.]
QELIRIRDLHTLYFGETMPEDVVAVDGDVRREVADALRRSGYIQQQDTEDDALFDALMAYIRTENFEEREQRRGYLDRAVLEYMKGQS